MAWVMAVIWWIMPVIFRLTAVIYTGVGPRDAYASKNRKSQDYPNIQCTPNFGVQKG